MNASNHDQELAGMTVNERLFAKGLLGKFDCAARARSRSELISLLKEVEVDDASTTADAILANPQHYGF